MYRLSQKSRTISCKYFSKNVARLLEYPVYNRSGDFPVLQFDFDSEKAKSITEYSFGIKLYL